MRLFGLSSIKVIPINLTADEAAQNRKALQAKRIYHMCSTIKVFANSEKYLFTEVCIGIKKNFDIGDRYFFALNREDVGYLEAEMVPRMIEIIQRNINALDFVLFLSKVRGGERPDVFDLEIKLRCILNTPTADYVSMKEENLYKSYAKSVENYAVANATNSGDLSSFRDQYLNEIELKYPNKSADHNLTNKLGYFGNYVLWLCDPDNGSPENIPKNDARYFALLECTFMKRRVWKEKRTRKVTLKNAARKHLQCHEIIFKEINLNDLNLKDFHSDRLEIVKMKNVNLPRSTKTWLPALKNIEFTNLTVLSLNSCGIAYIPKAAFDYLPPTLEDLNLDNNDIRRIPKNIMIFIKLKTLSIEGNQNLWTDGIPWSRLPINLSSINFKKTKILKLPPMAIRLIKLSYVELCDLQENFLEKLPLNMTGLSIGNNITRTFWYDEEKTDMPLQNVTKECLNCADLSQDLTRLEINITPNFSEANLLPRLKTLIVQGAGMKTINWDVLPSSISFIDFSNNELKEIGNLKHMTFLTDLRLSSNKIEVIAQGLPSLYYLLECWFDDNCLATLPDKFEHSTSINTLIVKKNKFNLDNIDETLWNRLPSYLDILVLDDNDLREIPCMLASLNLSVLRANNCNLKYICPSIYSGKNGAKFFELDVRKNPELKNLSFVPKTITLPPSNLNKPIPTDGKRISSFTVISDAKEFQNTSKFPQRLKNFVYDFKEEGISIIAKCECCARCSREYSDSPTPVKQMMPMDFALIQIVKTKNVRYPMTFYEPQYFPNQWKTEVVTKLCKTCIEWFKTEADRVEKQPKKQKEKKKKLDNENNFEPTLDPQPNAFLDQSYAGKSASNMEVDEMECTLYNQDRLFSNKEENSKHLPSTNNRSTVLSLKNLNFDCFLIAAVNFIDAMEDFRTTICINSRLKGIQKTQKDLCKIFERKVFNVEALRKSIPSFVENNQEDAVCAVIKLIEALDKNSQNLVQYSYDTVETCLCGVNHKRQANNCITLPLTVGQESYQITTFDSMINNWQRFTSNKCSSCDSEIITEHIVKLGCYQQYLIVELNTRVNGPHGMVQCSVPFNNFNINGQLIFGNLWELKAAIQYTGNGTEGHYITRKKTNKTWIVINDDRWKHENFMLSDMNEYRVLVFKKLSVEIIPQNNFINEDEISAGVTYCNNVQYIPHSMHHQNYDCYQIPQQIQQLQTHDPQLTDAEGLGDDLRYQMQPQSYHVSQTGQISQNFEHQSGEFFIKEDNKDTLDDSNWNDNNHQTLPSIHEILHNKASTVFPLTNTFSPCIQYSQGNEGHMFTPENIAIQEAENNQENGDWTYNNNL